MKAVRLEQPFLPAAGWSRRLAVFSATLSVLSGAGHRFGFMETVPFLWLLGICGMLAFAALIAGVVALVQFWETGANGVGSAVIGIIVSCVVLAPFGVSAVRLVELPPLVDISTDPDIPPRLARAAELRHGAMNDVEPISREAAELQREHYPHITGRRYEQTADTVLQTVREVMADRKWRPTGPAQPSFLNDSVTLEAEAASFLLGFPSDVAIRIRDDGTATFVDMRSASRYGRHDLGENAQRISRFLEELDTRMALQAGL